MTKCSYFPKCTGCSSWDTPYSKQKMNKISHLQQLLDEHNINIKDTPEFISSGASGLRHRVDFTIEYNQESKQHFIGFYDNEKQIINIEQCLQLDSTLQKIYTEFIKFKFFYGHTPIKKGSVRLRIGPTGLKGCWLDFSNIDIKYLLEDQKLLCDILAAGFIVEIGQKGKRLIRKNSILKLDDPISEVWFKSIDRNNQSLLLKSLISDFTQPSWTTAEVLTHTVLTWIDEIGTIESILEFGSGIGQFTLSFLQQKFNVAACEINLSATKYLLENAKNYKLENNLNILVGDFHKKTLESDKKFDLVFVNPSRSGLKKFTDEIIQAKPEYLIYVSCFPESMVRDFLSLSSHFTLCNIKIIDQFPQTMHFETCALLKKLN